MNLLITNDIDKNVFSTNISIKEMGTASLTAEEESAILADFPTKVLFKNLVFVGKFDADNGLPVLTTDDTGEEVKLELTNQEIPLDENFTTIYRVDMNKIPGSELGTVLNTRELLAQAKCVLFTSVIKAEIKRIMEDIRSKATAFTGETEEII